MRLISKFLDYNFISEHKFEINFKSSSSSNINTSEISPKLKNPFLFTKYTGFTPELPGNQNEAGIEINVYPISSVFLIGLNVEFR